MTMTGDPSWDPFCGDLLADHSVGQALVRRLTECCESIDDALADPAGMLGLSQAAVAAELGRQTRWLRGVTIKALREATGPDERLLEAYEMVLRAEQFLALLSSCTDGPVPIPAGPESLEDAPAGTPDWRRPATSESVTAQVVSSVARAIAPPLVVAA